MPKNKENLCFSCAFIFEAKEGESIVCPECSFTIERVSYNRILEPARDAAVFGYFYRKAFERNAKEGNTKTRYALVVDDIFIFLALAVISGVFGNAAHDASKAAFRRIIGEAHARYEQWGELTQLRLLKNDKDIDRFVEYIVEFPQSVRELPVEIRMAIVEEMLVDVAVDRLPKDKENLSREEFEKILKDSFSQSIEGIVKRLRNSSAETHQLWENVLDIDETDT
jgi:hypothetical protein